MKLQCVVKKLVQRWKLIIALQLREMLVQVVHAKKNAAGMC